MRVKILGSAAGGGFPQWNCACSNCSSLRKGKLRGSARMQAQVAISSDNRNWFLLNASPDLTRQIEGFPSLQPSALPRETPIAAILLTSGDIDQVLGLMLLRESQPLRVYSTPSIRKLLTENNIVFEMLRDQTRWDDIVPGREFGLVAVGGESSGLYCLPFATGGNYPYYAGDRAGALAPNEAIMGLVVHGSRTGGCLAYLPAVGRIDDGWLDRAENCDVLLFDGTFWSDDELIRVRGGGRTALEMGHIPVSGPEGSLRRMARVKRPRKVYIHVNNTNPILDESSPEYRQVRDAGWEVAADGMEFNL